MDAATTVRRVRRWAGLSLRELAQAAGTSHSTLLAYETGNKVPVVSTLDRIVRAAGFHLTAEILPLAGGADRVARGRELEEVLELASLFPSRPRPLTPRRFGS